ncbi:hypothetical protein GGQ85_003405 [Nitrobacter vulgaris]|nr:hypothetical protein [Nitrobacter vulgaris]
MSAAIGLCDSQQHAKHKIVLASMSKRVHT